ncbi:MAG: hypothetical protein CMH56_09340 [Myxococcales bacterium]|nr:hypothetical protein [Myxococcales bacterium]
MVDPILNYRLFLENMDFLSAFWGARIPDWWETPFSGAPEHHKLDPPWPEVQSFRVTRRRPNS